MGSNETAPLPAISTSGRCSTIPSARRMSKQARNVSTVCVLGRADVSSITAQMTSQPKPAGGRVKAMQHETRSDLCSAWAMSSSRSSRPGQGWSSAPPPRIRMPVILPEERPGQTGTSHPAVPPRRSRHAGGTDDPRRRSGRVLMVGVALLVRAGAGWGEHPIARLGRPQPGGGDRPTTFMDKVVMPRAEQDGVVDVGRAACFPRGDVVCVGAAHVDPASGERAVTIPAFESAAQPRRHDPVGASDVENFVGVLPQPL